MHTANIIQKLNARRAKIAAKPLTLNDVRGVCPDCKKGKIYTSEDAQSHSEKHAVYQCLCGNIFAIKFDSYPYKNKYK